MAIGGGGGVMGRWTGAVVAGCCVDRVRGRCGWVVAMGGGGRCWEVGWKGGAERWWCGWWCEGVGDDGEVAGSEGWGWVGAGGIVESFFVRFGDSSANLFVRGPFRPEGVFV